MCWFPNDETDEDEAPLCQVCGTEMPRKEHGSTCGDCLRTGDQRVVLNLEGDDVVDVFVAGDVD